MPHSKAQRMESIRWLSLKARSSAVVCPEYSSHGKRSNGALLLRSFYFRGPPRPCRAALWRDRAGILTSLNFLSPVIPSYSAQDDKIEETVEERPFMAA